MRKEDKSTIIEQIAATVKEYGHFYLVDVTAMNAAATSALRRDCFKSDIKLMLVKNTLLHKALESLEEDFSPLYGSLKPCSRLCHYSSGLSATNSMAAGVTFFDWYKSPSFFRRPSGTATMPTLGSMVQKG